MDWKFIGTSLVVSYLFALAIAAVLVWMGANVNLADPYQEFSWDAVFEVAGGLEFFFVLIFLGPYALKQHRRNKSRP